MRTIKYTRRFKRDYKREKSGRHGKTLDQVLMDVVSLLATDTALPRQSFDHALSRLAQRAWAVIRLTLNRIDNARSPQLVNYNSWCLLSRTCRRCYWPDDTVSGIKEYECFRQNTLENAPEPERMAH